MANVWKPGHCYSFPKRLVAGKLRKFLYTWLCNPAFANWLCYSRYFDGAFCLPCICFGRQIGKRGLAMQRLFSLPLKNWATATQKFKQHCSSSPTHIDAVAALANFRTIASQAAVPVDRQIHAARERRIAENRTKIGSIIKSVIFCGRNGISLRGSSNENNIFHDLLRFRIASGDTRV